MTDLPIVVWTARIDTLVREPVPGRADDATWMEEPDFFGSVAKLVDLLGIRVVPVPSRWLRGVAVADAEHREEGAVARGHGECEAGGREPFQLPAQQQRVFFESWEFSRDGKLGGRGHVRPPSRQRPG